MTWVMALTNLLSHDISLLNCKHSLTFHYYIDNFIELVFYIQNIQPETDDDYIFIVSPDVIRFSRHKVSFDH